MDEKALKSIPLFASLSKSDRRQVAASTDEVELSEGEVLVNEGDFAYEFFIIEEGTAEVLRDGKHVEEVETGRIRSGVSCVEGKGLVPIAQSGPCPVQARLEVQKRQHEAHESGDDDVWIDAREADVVQIAECAALAQRTKIPLFLRRAGVTRTGRKIDVG